MKTTYVVNECRMLPFSIIQIFCNKKYVFYVTNNQTMYLINVNLMIYIEGSMYMSLLIVLGIGVLLGVIDLLPMLKQKLDRFSCASAFVFHLIMPFVLYGNSWDLDFWIKGGILYLLMAFPLMILAAKDDPKAAPMMGISSCILGMISGLLISLI